MFNYNRRGFPKHQIDRSRATVSRKRFRYYIYGSALTIVVFFSAAELLTRTVSWISGNGFTLALHELDAHDPGIMNVYQWHPFTGLIFKPNIIFHGSHPRQSEAAAIKVDKHGFLAKDHTLSPNKVDNEVRIATIGGSTTANIGLTFEENWPGRLGYLLQQAFPQKNITVINAGVPGFDTAQSISNLALRVMPFEPDLVIIYHAYNDLKAVRPGVPFKPDYSHIHTKPYGYHEKPGLLVRWLNRSMFYVRVRNGYRQLVKTNAYLDRIAEKGRLASVPAQAERVFEQHIRTLVATAQEGGAKVVLSSFATLHDPGRDYSARNSIATLSTLQKQELDGLLHFTPGLTIAGIFNGIERYNAILKRVAEQKQTGWVDNANSIPHLDEYFMDRVHFSSRGAALMAENLLPTVLRQLER